MIGSMLSVGLFSLTFLATAIAIEKGQWRGAMFCSFAVSALGLGFFLGTIWLADNLEWQTRRLLHQSMGEFAVIGVGLPLAGLLSLTRFDNQALQLVRLSTLTLVGICGATLTLGIWSGGLEPNFEKFLAVVCIATGLGIVALPLLHKLAGLPPPSETVAVDLTMAIVCPRCALSQMVTAGPSRCQRCRLRFVIEIEEPRCPTCGYLLFQLTEPRCPECGHTLSTDDVIAGESPLPLR